MSTSDKKKAARRDLVQFAEDIVRVLKDTCGLHTHFEVGFIRELSPDFRRFWDEMDIPESEKREFMVIHVFVKVDGEVKEGVGQNFYPGDHGTSQWEARKSKSCFRIINSARQWGKWRSHLN